MKNKEVADFCIDMHRDRLTPSKLLQFMELLYSVSEPIRIILHLATPLSLIILPAYSISPLSAMILSIILLRSLLTPL